MAFGTRIALAITHAALVVVMIGGCNGDASDDAPGVITVTNVDPARATARALFDHVRSLCDPRNPDAEGYYALVHTETPKQQEWMAFVGNALLPRARFAKACREQFGEGPASGKAMLWEIAAFTWLSEDADRAEIECVNDHGVKSPLHLVKLGDQWWISGYTFEYAKHIGFDDPRFHELTQSVPGIGPYIDRATARVRAGEFSTLDAAEEAQSDAIGEYARDHQPTRQP